MHQNYSQLFYKESKPKQSEIEKEREKKFKILLNKKVFVKKKSSAKDRS